MDYLTTAPLWISVTVLVIVPTLVAMTGPHLVRRFIGLENLSANNEVAGFKFAVVGVLYSVLLAFAVIAVWERFTESDSQAAYEAGAAETVYRLSHSMGAETGPVLRARVTDYLRAAIDQDWPAMAHGEGSPAATAALNELYAAVVRFSPTDPREEQILYELLYQLDQITQARRDRLAASSGLVPGVLWVVLVGGGVLTVGFTLFFGTRNLRAQSMMTGILTLLVSFVLFVVVAVDRPFAGAARVNPEALAAVMEDLGGREAPRPG